jgi:coiled-coil-helix-coiled-coil-helix domain-containing protein 2
MAATAGSVAVGSTIGHGISSMLFGGRSESAPVEQSHPAASQQNTSSFAPNCEVQAKDFSKCIEKADLPSCSWYLEQLKAVSFAIAIYVSALIVVSVCSARQLLPNTDRTDASARPPP